MLCNDQKIANKLPIFDLISVHWPLQVVSVKKRGQKVDTGGDEKVDKFHDGHFRILLKK